MSMKDSIFLKTVISEKGFSLIELITFIIIGGIILPVSIIAFTGSLGNYSVPDNQVKARFYAEQKIEEVTSQPFGTLACSAPNPDTPETSFSRTCSIGYVQYNSVSNAIEDTGSATNYQKITVAVTPPEGSTYTYSISTIVTKRPKVP